VFRRPSSPDKTIAWSSDPQAPAPLAFGLTSSLRVVNRLGNVTFVTDGGAGDMDGKQNGSVTLLMTADPVIVSK
jgi:hypothetical protein